ncbi:helix-turn-helix domain-containing protein [Rhodococcus olei]|uniref:Helix-turn-helix domain-containing protein n=1 Tax=Rhodococcus olei TaxID=2161675 RepID=A0ABP8P6N2_9NOCA
MGDVTASPLPETCATLWVWLGHAVYLGPSLRLGSHSTSVRCLVLGVDAPFVLSSDGPTSRTRSALIPPRTTHRVAAGGDRMLFCYFEPTARRGAAELMTGTAGPFGLAHRDEGDLIARCRVPDPDPLALLDAAGGPTVTTTDPRVDEAARELRADPARPVGAEEFARAARLSPTHFLRLFAAETGTSFRRYRMWARMVHVAGSLAKGADLTGAAMDAGFASPSHFSDVFRATFGLTATDLLATGVRIRVLDAAIGATRTGH